MLTAEPACAFIAKILWYSLSIEAVGAHTTTYS